MMTSMNRDMGRRVSCCLAAMPEHRRWREAREQRRLAEPGVRDFQRQDGWTRPHGVGIDWERSRHGRILDNDNFTLDRR